MNTNDDYATVARMSPKEVNQMVRASGIDLSEPITRLFVRHEHSLRVHRAIKEGLPVSSEAVRAYGYQHLLPTP